MYLVVETHNEEDSDGVYALGLYDNKEDAVSRVNEEFLKCKTEYAERFGEGISANSSGDGYAHLFFNLGFNGVETYIRIQPIETGKPITIEL